MTKPTLVLIPGLLCDASVWQHQVALLKDYATIIIPDVTKLQDANAVIQFILSTCPKKCYLAGHSMGGWLALEFMRNHQDRVEKLCILASSASLDSSEKTQLRKECLNLLPTLSKRKMAAYLAQLYIYNPKIQSQLKDMFERNMTAFFHQQQAMMQRLCCENVLPTIKVPTTIIAGVHDTEFFNSSKFIADHIPQSSFLTLDCGHMLTMEKPQQCTELLLEWLINNPTII